MGRKKSELDGETEEILSAVDKIYKSIEKSYGKGLIKNAQSVIDNPRKVISFSPAHDIALGGGIPMGSWVILNGPNKSGKSTQTIHFAVSFQKSDPSYHVYYLDIEGRLKPMYIHGAKGLDITRFHHIKSEKGNILAAEDFLGIAEQIIRDHPCSLIIMDSWSCLATETELVEDITKQQRGDGNKLVAKFCRRNANIVPINECIIWGMTQNIANTSGYGAPVNEKISNALAYQADIRLKIKKSEFINGSGKNSNRVIGQKAEMKVITAALGPPGMEYECYTRYGIGIDEVAELISISLSLGLIDQAGAWFNFREDLGGEKAQGFEGMHRILSNSEDLQKRLMEKIKEELG